MDYVKAGLFAILIFAVILSGCTQENIQPLANDAPSTDDGQDGTAPQIEPQPETPAQEPSPNVETGTDAGPTAPLPTVPPAGEPGSTPPVPPTPLPTEPPAEQPPSDGNGTTANVKEFDVTARNWEFEPSTITVNRGDTVKLHITSADVAHGFVISAYGINKTLNPGQTVDVEFVADKAGSFPFLCNVFCGDGHSTMN